MLRFEIEWDDGPQVRDRLLQSTWARLEIHVSDGSHEFCLTDCVSWKSQSLRQSVYGSVLPLAQWVVQNWWSILREDIRTESFTGGRSLAQNPMIRPWVQRHNLLAGRGGFALPDVTLYYDGGLVAVRSVPDPFAHDSTYPVRFVSDVDIRLRPEDADAGLRELVEKVVDRVRDHAPQHSEARELLDDWEAVKESVRSEAVVCETAAAMGLDPYNPAELTEDVLGLIEGLLATYWPGLRQDLAETTTGASLGADMMWIQEAARRSAVNLKGKASTVESLHGTLHAHRVGYERARLFRERFGPPPNTDLDAYVQSRVGWAPIEEAPQPVNGVASRINGLVGYGSGGTQHLVPASGDMRAESRRFLIGRALFFSSEATDSQAPRLLTRASSWPQRASRAFAAELLAPASELTRRVGKEVTFGQIDNLAQEFGVNQLVIQHQLVNHGIATVVDL